MNLLDIPEKIIKPVVLPIFNRLLKPIKLIPTLPKKGIMIAQQWLKKLLTAKNRSKDQYVLMGRVYVAKKLLVIILLLICILIYFLFIKPPAFLNKWLDRPKVIHLKTDQSTAYSGLAQVFREDVFTYEGPLVDGLYEGQGKLYNGEDKLIYDGEFKKGIKEGAGELYSDTGELIYKGQFAENRYSGAGTLFYPDRTMQYEGDFKNGKFSGTGSAYDSSGTLRYAGQYVDGVYSGRGQLFDETGTLRYDGDLQKGVYHGSGKLYDETGKIMYEGGFLDGEYAGSGTAYYADGVPKYIGQFAAGVYHGSGESHSEAGNPLYIGSYAKGQFHGSGKQFDDTGAAVYEGKFAEGMYEGFGSLLDAESNVVFRSYFARGQIALESFLGLSAGKLEELLGAPADVIIPELVTIDAEPLDDGFDDAADEEFDILVSALEAPPLPTRVEYSYAPMLMALELNVPADETEPSIAGRVRVWNPKVLALLPEAWRDHPPFRDKAGSAVRVERTVGADGTYMLEYIIGEYYYTLLFNRSDELKSVDIHRI